MQIYTDFCKYFRAHRICCTLPRTSRQAKRCLEALAIMTEYRQDCAGIHINPLFDFRQYSKRKARMVKTYWALRNKEERK